ncbi:molybdopterin-dependent oxidoreductase [Actinoplanes sp. NPDC051633]|uniref:molybdopterin-dependent oxidoreductase n=1 Tax=Actinoplanes sp. NPDC051633 TaxID=3155670 RepID=UPI00341C7E34
MRIRKPALGALAVLLSFGIGGCGRDDGPAAPAAQAKAATVISAASITAGQAVPVPSGKAALTLGGKITRGNRKGALLLDVATIEKIGVKQIGVYEPWVKQNLDFRGVWLSDLLAVAGVAPGATKLHVVAHDDYAVDIPLADVKEGDIMLATRSGDGAALPLDNGGPTRVIYADGVSAGANPDQWIWSLKTIDVL